MTQLRYRCPVWVKLALAALVLLGALTALFLALGRPMPTPELAAAMAGRSLLLGDGEVVAQGPVAGSQGNSDFYRRETRWVLLESGTGHTLCTVERLGPFWRLRLGPYFTSREAPIWDWNWIVSTNVEYGSGEDPMEEADWMYEQLYLAVTRNPRVARVEGKACWVPDTVDGQTLTREEREAYLEEHGAIFSLTETAPDSGVWTGTVATHTPSGGSGLISRVTAYDDRGDVVAQTSSPPLS